MPAGGPHRPVDPVDRPVELPASPGGVFVRTAPRQSVTLTDSFEWLPRTRPGWPPCAPRFSSPPSQRDSGRCLPVISRFPQSPGGLKEMDGDACHRRSPGSVKELGYTFAAYAHGSILRAASARCRTTFRCGSSLCFRFWAGLTTQEGVGSAAGAGSAGSRPRRLRSLGPWLTSPVSCCPSGNKIMDYTRQPAIF
jgi:hypothetical protein